METERDSVATECIEEEKFVLNETFRIKLRHILILSRVGPAVTKDVLLPVFSFICSH